MPSVLWCCWLGSRKGIRPVKTEWWGDGVVICEERGADLHIAKLMPLPLTVSCFSKIQIGFTFLVPAHRGSHGQRAVRWVCVCDWLAIHKTRSDDATYLSAAITTANNNQQGTAHSFDRQTHCIGMVNSLVNVDLYSAIITKVSNALNTLVSGEKPGFQTLSKVLVVLLCSICSKMTSSIKPEAHTMSQWRCRRSEPWLKETCSENWWRLDV